MNSARDSQLEKKNNNKTQEIQTQLINAEFKRHHN